MGKDEAKRYKRVLVLTGGSIKGAFQAGATAEVLKTFHPDLICGVSIGALNGAFVVDRQGGDPLKSLEKIGEELTEFWIQHIRSFSDVGKKRSILKLLIQIFTGHFKGLLNMDKYHQLVYKTFDIERIRKSTIDYAAGYVNVKTGNYCESKKSGNDVAPDLINYIIASGGTPILYPTFYIKDEPLLDGGLRHVAPFTDLSKFMDDGEIICVSCHPHQLDPEDKDFKPGNLLELVERVMEIAVNEMVNNDIEKRELINRLIDQGYQSQDFWHKKVKMKVIRPAKELRINLQNFNSKDIDRLIREGREAAKKVVEDEKAWF